MSRINNNNNLNLKTRTGGLNIRVMYMLASVNVFEYHSGNLISTSY